MKSNLKTKRVIGILSILFFCFITLWIFDRYQPFLHSGKAETLLTQKTALLDKDEFCFDDDIYNISYYGNFAGNTREILTSEVPPNLQYLNVTGDDAITTIIPKQYFLNVGKHIETGKEWGYFIDTIIDFTDPNKEESHVSYNRRSFVTIFDFIYTINKNGIIEVGVSVLYQYQYLTLTPQEELATVLQGGTWDAPTMIGGIKYKLPGDDTYVILSLGGAINPRYYLKDISFAMSSLNEQAPNVGFSTYSPTQDNGCFFTYMDYEYEGIVRENNSFPTKEAISLGKDFFKVGLSAAEILYPSAVPILEGIKSCLTIADRTNHTIDFFEAFSNYVDNPVINQTVEKHITAENFCANRDDQINEYNGLIKTLGIAVNTEEQESIWYGSKNKAMGIFKITSSAINNTAKEYTRLIREIAFDIVDVTNDKVVETVHASDTFYLNDPIYKEVELKQEVGIFILPGGKNFFKFTPQYTGKYTLDYSDYGILSAVIKNEKEVIPSRDNSYFLKEGKTYYIEIGTANDGALSTLSINVTQTDVVTDIGSEEHYVIKHCFSDGDTVYNISTGSSNILITDILVYEQDGFDKHSVFEEYGPYFSVDVPLYGNVNYYFILKNKSSVALNSTLTFSTLKVGELGKEESINFDGTNFSYLKIPIVAQGEYIISAVGLGTIYFRIYDEKLEKMPINLMGYGCCSITAGKEQNIYIGIKSSQKCFGKGIINISEKAYSWWIDGEKVPGQLVELIRGKEYEVKFFVNGKEVQQNLQITDFSQKYSIAINSKGNLEIESFCVPGGEGIILQCVDEADLAYRYLLKVVPIIEFKGISKIINGEDIGFYWINTRDLQSISYTLKVANEVKNFKINTSKKTEGSECFESIRIQLKTFSQKSGLVFIHIFEVEVKTNNENSRTVDYESDAYMDGFFGGGDGNTRDPYLIASQRHFDNIRYNSDKNFNIINNIELNAVIEPINEFKGTLGTKTGKQIKISWTYQYYFDDTIPVNFGLFIYNYGWIGDLLFEINIEVNHTSYNKHYFGGIVAFNYGKIENCMIIGTGINIQTLAEVSGGFAGVYVGGCAAVNGGQGSIRNCSCIVEKISGGGYIGGIVGLNYGNVTDCMISARACLLFFINGTLGGIVGTNYGTVSDCICGNSDSIVGLEYAGSASNSTVFNPYMGYIIGKNLGTMLNCRHEGMWLSKGALTTVNRHDQAQYVGSKSNGLIGG